MLRVTASSLRSDVRLLLFRIQLQINELKLKYKLK